MWLGSVGHEIYPECLRAKQPLWASWRAIKRECSKFSHLHKSTKPSNEIRNLRTKQLIFIRKSPIHGGTRGRSTICHGKNIYKWWKILENPLSFQGKSWNLQKSQRKSQAKSIKVPTFRWRVVPPLGPIAATPGVSGWAPVSGLVNAKGWV